MTYRDQQRLIDIAEAITAIRAHVQRGGLSDGLVFDAVRIRRAVTRMRSQEDAQLDQH